MNKFDYSRLSAGSVLSRANAARELYAIVEAHMPGSVRPKDVTLTEDELGFATLQLQIYGVAMFEQVMLGYIQGQYIITDPSEAPNA